jgi:cytochrome b involved in lipid metabolism
VIVLPVFDFKVFIFCSMLSSVWMDALSSHVTPMNIFLAVLCLYSFVVNTMFGHPTYWRKSSSSSKLSSFDIVTPEQSITGRVQMSTRVSNGIVCEGTANINVLNDDLVVLAFEYMSPYGLTQLCQVSKRFSHLSKHKKLWRDLTEKLTAGTFCDSFRSPAVSPTMSSVVDYRKQYFEQQFNVFYHLLESEDMFVVMIHNRLYDLTQFTEEHPGGASILEEYRGRDATKIFENACHSTFARELSDNFLFFSPEQLNCARGVPKFSLRIGT